MGNEERRPPAEKPVSLWPLDFETALEAALETGPHPREPDKDQPKPKQTKKKGRT
jgi:hypothetical protein